MPYIECIGVLAHHVTSLHQPLNAPVCNVSSASRSCHSSFCVLSSAMLLFSDKPNLIVKTENGEEKKMALRETN